MIPPDVLALPLLPGDKAMMVDGLPHHPPALPFISSEAMIVPGCLASLILLRSRCPRNFCRRREPCIAHCRRPVLSFRPFGRFQRALMSHESIASHLLSPILSILLPVPALKWGRVPGFFSSPGFFSLERISPYVTPLAAVASHRNLELK